MDGVIPDELKVGVQMPRGIKAYRRQFRSPATNTSEAGPDQHVDIYPDTSTPGSFIDPQSTYLSFDLIVRNDNFMLDYTHFGPEGVGGAIIQDWRVYNQGSILEEILEYGTAASLMSVIDATFQDEVTLFYSNKLKGTQRERHLNFIKPPMCDSNGQIMHGLNPFGLGYTPQGRSGYATAGVSTLAAGALVNGGGLQFAPVSGVTPVINTQNSPYVNEADAVYLMPTNKNAAGRSENQPRQANPMDWPDFYSPQQSEIVKANYIHQFGSVNKAQIMANLANVRCVPIGMVPAQDCHSTEGSYGAPKADTYKGTYVRGVALPQGTPPRRSNVTYRICYQPLSGIFGRLASKMLATMLMGPQQVYIALRLASTSVALNTASDPCRRLAGSIRDYVRNIGQKNGAYWGDRLWTDLAAGNTPWGWEVSDFATGYGPNYSIPITAGTTSITSVINTMFTDAASEGRVTSVKASLALGEAPNVSLPPAPQYVPMVAPWKYKGVTTSGFVPTKYANDRQIFYGSNQEASVPQSKRMFQFSTAAGDEASAFTTDSSSYPYSGTGLSYAISNIALVGDQIILPNEVAADVVSAAAAGQYHVSTRSIRTYNVAPTAGATQAMILPVKVAKAQQLFCVFQNSEQRSTATGLYYNSNCGYNIFSTIHKGSNNTNANIDGFINATSTTASTPSTLYGVGYTNPLVYTPTSSGASSLSVQLRIGNEFFPQSPITKFSELSAEYVKTLQGWTDLSYSPEVWAPMAAAHTAGSDAATVYDCLSTGLYSTAFVNAELLDDQTIIQNQDMIPLYSVQNGAIASKAQDEDSQANGARWMCPRGHCLQNVFEVPRGRFALGFNLLEFGRASGVSGGAYLGNNTIILALSGAVGLETGNWRCVVVVPHTANMQYMGQGQIVWSY